MDKKIYKMRLKRGDSVMVRSGKHTGKTGKIIQVYPKLNKVAVEGINIVKRHRKPSQTNPRGTITEITKPLWASQVGYYDEAKKKPSRIGYMIDKSGNKRRLSKLSKREIK